MPCKRKDAVCERCRLYLSAAEIATYGGSFCEVCFCEGCEPTRRGRRYIYNGPPVRDNEKAPEGEVEPEPPRGLFENRRGRR